MKSLEFRFRILMGQEFDLANDLAFYNVNLSPDDPNYRTNFNEAILIRDALSEVAKSMFRIAFHQWGTQQRKTDEVNDTMTIWDAVRTALGVNHWGTPYQSGEEPIPTIEVINEDTVSESIT